LHWFAGAWQDLRFTLRLFRKRPGFGVIVIGTIALGVGASTAIFSVVHAVLMKPLAYRDPDRLVSLAEEHLSMPGLDRLSYATGRDLLRRSGVIEDILYYGDGGGGRLIDDGEAEVLRGQRVTANFFDGLGIRAEIGRTFVADDRLPGGSDVIILSHALWQTRFAGDPQIIGRPLRLSGRLIRVIGVLPAAFHPMHMSNPGEIPQVFQPFEIGEVESEDRSAGTTAIARLKSGVTHAQARAALNTIMRNLVLEHPADYPRDVALIVQPLDEKLTGNVRIVLWVLLGAVGFVLVVTCANVANLLLTRASARETEMAVRAALGCSRWRLVRQVLTESIVLSLWGGLAGVLLAWAATAALVSLAPTEIPRADEIRMDTSILLFALLISLVTAVLFGLAPALKAARLGLNEILQGSRDPSGGRTARALRHGLVIAQIASAFVLAIGAGLLGRSLDQLLRVDAGYDPHHLLTMTTFIYGGTTEKDLHHYQRIVERVRVIPGVLDAAMVSTLPLSSPQQTSVYVEGRSLQNEAEAPVFDSYFASPDYFRVMRIPLRRGRFFTSQDGLKAPAVAIVSESCARSLFPNEDPIGKRIGFGDRIQWVTIIGIVGDVWQHGMDEGPSAGVYGPQAQHPDYYYRLLVRTSGDPWRAYPAVREALRELDPNQPMFHVQPMDDYVTKSLADRIFALSLVGLLGMLALALAAIGIYGVVSYTVSVRTKELGIRMALGADAVTVLGLVIRDLLAMLGAGLGIGFLTTIALTRLLAHLLYGVQASDLATILTAALTLAVAAVAAAFVPCRRAISVNPSTALRDI
jgi:putative ABC transport system permease protein